MRVFQLTGLDMHRMRARETSENAGKQLHITVRSHNDLKNSILYSKQATVVWFEELS